MSYKATLIISVYNNTKFLKLVLDSLSLQTEKNVELIISEDGESAEMREFVASYPFENDYRHLTQVDEGWRKNKALNNAIRAATSDWLIFIDGDCVLHPRFVEMHLRYADEKLILAGKRVKMDEETSRYLENNFAKAIHKLQKIFLKKLIFGKGETDFIEESIFVNPNGILGFIPKLRKARRLIGSNMSFSKQAIYAINGFDEMFKLPAVGEDTDLYWRFEGKGFRVKSVRNLAVQYHLYHKESWHDTSENMKMMERNKRLKKYLCEKGLKQPQK